MQDLALALAQGLDLDMVSDYKIKQKMNRTH